MTRLSPWLTLAVVLAGVAPVSARPPRAPSQPTEKSGVKPTPEKEKGGEEEKKPAPEPDRYFALVGGRVHTITGPTFPQATILCKNGKIVAIAPELELPAETEQFDVTGYQVYPGLVAASSGTILGASPADDTTNVFGLNMTLALAGGITTAVADNAAYKLSYGTTDDMVVGKDLLASLSYSSSDPNGRRALREKLDRVRQYIRDVERYEREKRIDPEAKEPEKDWLKGEYEKLHTLLKREKAAEFSASRVNDLLSVAELARAYGLRAVVRGAAEAWIVAPELARAGIAVVISPRQRVERDERLNRPSGSSIENAAILNNHGIALAIVPETAAITLWGLAGQDLLHLNMEAAFGVRGGLPESAAIEAITIGPARLLGIDHRVGSIEVGKDADFAIADGDLLHYMSHIRWTVVNGRLAYDKQEDTLFDHIRPGGDRDAPPPDDYWPRRLGETR